MKRKNNSNGVPMMKGELRQGAEPMSFVAGAEALQHLFESKYCGIVWILAGPDYEEKG
jgi:hypothetical protein